MKIAIFICVIAGFLSSLQSCCCFFPLAAASVAHLEEVCTVIEGPNYLPREFCKAVLLTDPRSLDADDRALGGISIDILIANVTALRAELEALWQKERNESSRALLRACEKIYGDKSDFLQTAKQSAKAGYFGAAATSCDDFQSARWECQRIFDANKVAIPVEEDIGLLYVATNLARALNFRLGDPSKNKT